MVPLKLSGKRINTDFLFETQFLNLLKQLILQAYKLFLIQKKLFISG